MQRGVTPHWYKIACQANNGDTKAREWLGLNGVHSSEYSWAGTEFDQIINNDGSIEQLYTQLKNLVQSPPASKEDVSALRLADSLSIQSLG